MSSGGSQASNTMSAIVYLVVLRYLTIHRVYIANLKILKNRHGKGTRKSYKSTLFKYIYI